MRCGFHFFFFEKNALLLCVSSYLCYPKISSFFFFGFGLCVAGFMFTLMYLLSHRGQKRTTFDCLAPFSRALILEFFNNPYSCNAALLITLFRISKFLSPPAVALILFRD